MMNQEELIRISNQFGTPSFVFDLEKLRNRVNAMKEIVGGKYQLCYSIKANPFLIPEMVKLVDHLEVCSPGELDICKNLKVPGETIVYSGVNKGAADIEEAITYGAGVLTAESLHHMDLIQMVAEKLNRTVDVLPRLNSGTQFGMSKEDLVSIIRNPEKYGNIHVVGVHYFVGTQRKKLEKQREELQMLREFFAEAKETYGFDLKRLEYGPGLAVPLFQGDDFSDTLQPLKELHSSLAEVCEFADLTIEMGRFIATECGTYVTSVADLKSVGDLNYCILDGGMNHVNYLGQMMGMKQPVIDQLANDRDAHEIYCLCGSLCTTNDVMVRKIEMKKLELGDVLAFHNIGAYSVTEGIHLFLSRTMPRIILRNKENDYVLARDFKKTSTINTPNV